MDKRIVFIALGIIGLILFLLQGSFIKLSNTIPNGVPNNIFDCNISVILPITTTTVTTASVTRPQLAIDLGK